MNIKNITTSCFCDCILRGEYYFTVISNFDCNLQCKNCINCAPLVGQQNLNFPEIDYEKTCETIKYFKNLGFKMVNISGGETLLYPKIFDLIRYCDGLGLYTTVNTNGLLIPKIKIPDDILSLLKSDKMRFIISLKGKYFDNSKAIDFLEKNKLSYRFSDTGNYKFNKVKITKEKNLVTKQIFKCIHCCPQILNDKIYFCSLAFRKEIFNLDYIENDLVFEYNHFKSIKDIKNVLTKKFKLCQNCSLSSNFEEEEISKSSLKIEEFVEV